MGDKIEIKGDAIGSAVGAGASVLARDIQVFKQAVDQSSGLDAEMKRVLKEAREALEQADLSPDDKTDVVENLGKLTAELEKPEKDAGLVQRYWGRIKEVTPIISSIISSAASVAKLTGIVP